MAKPFTAKRMVSTVAAIGSTSWIARRRVMPKWEVERRFNLPEGTLNLAAQAGRPPVEVAAADAGMEGENRDEAKT